MSSYLEQHYDEIFKKYSKEELLKDIENYKNGNGKLNKVLSYFFKECIYECCGKKTKISPKEALSDEKLTNKIIEYINQKPNFFTSTNQVSNVESCLRNSLSWVRKVANFPCREAKDIYFKYFPKYLDRQTDRLCCLDTSCGFGSRMSAVLLNGANYCGFDPNKKLFLKLKECKDFYYNNNIISKDQRCGLYCQGSEKYRTELKNLFDVSFTSPPYFNLEKYSNDSNESTLNYDNYNLWVKNFVYPTIENTYNYLKIGGYAMINTKDINKKETCYKDFYNAFLSIEGFEFIEVFNLKIIKKQYGMQYNNEKGNINNFEPIMVFRKVK